MGFLSGFSKVRFVENYGLRLLVFNFEMYRASIITKKHPSNNLISVLIISGTHPNVGEGIVSATGCVVESSEDCCGTQLELAIKNCSNFMVYHLIPPTSCSVGYCAGHRLRCPEGLTSPSGFTPCECKLYCTQKWRHQKPQVNMSYEVITRLQVKSLFQIPYP